jgi:beta-lactamase regulating signal transducer with metallopeptidase domain
MTLVSEILRSDPVYRLGWALLHSLWQIASLAAVSALLLAALRRRSANLRYVIGCAGLAAMFVLPVATYCVVPQRPDLKTPTGSMASGAAQPASMDPVPTDTQGPGAALPTVPPSKVVPSNPDAGYSSIPLAGQPFPEPVPSAQTPARLLKRVSRAISPGVPWLVVAWLAGVCLLSVWHLGGWIALQRLKHLGTTRGNDQWAQRLCELIERMQLSRPVRMLQSAVVDVPAVIGWLRPVLLLPAAMLGELSPQQIEAVLAHELAHIRRYDYLVNLFQTLVETLLFYHPGVWWLSRRIRIERENCCDDAAVAVCGSRVDYAAALMAMEQGRLVPHLAMAAGGADRGGTALSRVRRVLNVSGRDPGSPQTWWVGVLTGAVVVGLLAGYMATADERPGAPEDGPASKAILEAGETRQGSVQPAAPIPQDGAAAEPRPPAEGAAADWGPAVEGVQVRLRAGQSQWTRGTVPRLAADVRNGGKQDLWVAQAQELCELEVDGRWYRWVGGIAVKSSWFPPGRQYDDIQVSLGSPWASDGKPLTLEPGKRAVRVAFIASPTEDDAGKPVRAVSNPVEIEVVDAQTDKPAVETDEQWGPAVVGVQCRIQPDRKTWNAGETPTCRAFVRHQGRIEVWLSRVQVPESGLEVDGVWYRHPQERIRGAAYQRSSFWEKNPGAFQFSLDKEWVAAEGGQPLALSPGKHTVRYARAGFHAFYRRTISPTLYDEQRPVRLVSNPVEIEIVAEKIQWGHNANGLQAGLAFDLQERPYQMGELVSFRLYVRNLAGKTAELVDFGTTGWMPTVTDAAGKPVLVAGQFDGPVQRRRHTLPDGQTLLMGTVALMLDKDPEARATQPFHAHLEPGTYRISQKYRFADDPEATWSGELASGELELKVVPAPDAAAEVTDLQEFRQERERGDRANDFDTKLQHYRKALQWQSDHPEKLALEYQLAVMLKEFYNSRTATWPRRKEALAMFRHIVDSYDHMEYYTTAGAGGPWEAQVAVPNATIRAAWLLSAEGGDRKEVHQYLSRALDMMNETCRRRLREWSTAPREPAPDAFDGPLEQSKWQSRVAEWERRKKAAAEGEVLSKSELLTVEFAIPRLDPSKGAQASPEVITRLHEITERYPGTPIARIARQRLEAAKGDPGVLLRQLNAGELSDEKIRQITGQVLAIQGDLEQPWDPAWGNWLEKARVMGKVSDADFTRYAKQSNPTWQMEFNYAVDEHSGRVGLSFRYKHVGGRVASVYTNHSLIIKHRLVRLSLGELPLDVGGRGGEWSFVAKTGGPGAGFFRVPEDIDGLEKLRPGKYEAVLVLEAEIYETGRPDKTLHHCRIELTDEVQLAELLFLELRNVRSWGEAVQGVQCRLEADKPTWKPAEMLTLKAYVRHQTETTLFLSNHPMFGAQLEVDGHWHRWDGPMQWTGPSHSSRKFRTKDQQPLAITLDENWKQVDNKEPLRVDPGRHVIRFAWEGHPESGPREGPDEQRSIVLVSNPLEIIVPPERPEPKPSDVHADDRNAAAALWQLGGILAADDQGKIRTVRLSRTAVTDADLGHLKGLSGLKALYLDDTRITDAGLGHLAGLADLETLSLNYTRTTDAGLEHLKRLSRLRSLALLEADVTAAGLRALTKALPALRPRVDALKLSGLGDLRGWLSSGKLGENYELVSITLVDPKVTDAWLRRLKDQRNLQDVCLFHTQITDAGLAHLQGLTELRTLGLTNTRITDAGLKYLKDMKKLKTLIMAETPIGDAGLADLAGLTSLESLCINGTRVTDAGLVHVRQLGNLEALYLSQTSVSDASLKYVIGLKRLRVLEILDTSVTDDGIQRLQQVLPKATVYH